MKNDAYYDSHKAEVEKKEDMKAAEEKYNRDHGITAETNVPDKPVKTTIDGQSIAKEADEIGKAIKNALEQTKVKVDETFIDKFQEAILSMGGNNDMSTVLSDLKAAIEKLADKI